MINRRKFLAASAINALGLQAVSPDIHRSLEAAQADSPGSARGNPPRAQKLAGHASDSDDPVELMLEKLFGKKRNEPTPLPTIAHLDPADLFFVAFTDAHMGPAGVKKWMYLTIYNWRVEEVIRQINALHPEFAIHIGDSIWGAPWDPKEKRYEASAHTALEVFGKLQCPFHNVPGTHDFGQHHLPPNDSQVLAALRLGMKRYINSFGAMYYSFDAKGCKFIVYNNALAKVDLPEAVQQDQWLDEELPKAAAAKLAFFFSHEPFFLFSPDENGDVNVNVYLQPARAELLRKLAANGVDVLYSGHTHFDFGNQYKNMYLHTLCSCSNNRDFFSGLGTPRPFPLLALEHDPYKFGYLVVRVRDGEVHESWVSTYWRVNDPPQALAPMSGARLVCRPATEVEDSVLGTIAPPPPAVTNVNWESSVPRSFVMDHVWRLSENIGSKWLQAWPIPSSPEEWFYLKRGLTLGRPRGVKIAVPVPCDIVAMGEAWARVEPHSEAIAAVVVCNGGPSFFPALYNLNLTTWRFQEWALEGKGNEQWATETWAASCVEARKLIPPTTKVILGRLPLREVPTDYDDLWKKVPDPSLFGEPGSGLERIKETAVVLSRKADGIAVWMKCHKRPEEYAEEIAAAARIAKSKGLELWLDAVGWEYIDDSRRTAYFLRLIALCQAHGVRLFWWNGPENQGGLLDGFYDPTPMYYAAQAWQSFVDGPTDPVKVEIGEEVNLRWKDRRGREYAVWWQPSDQLTVNTAWKGFDFPSGALAADPMHGRLLNLNAASGLPLCSWPLILRAK